MFCSLFIVGAVAVAAHGGHHHHHHHHSSASGRSILQVTPGDDPDACYGRGCAPCKHANITASSNGEWEASSEEGAAILEIYIGLHGSEGGDGQRVGVFETFEIPMVFHVLNQPDCTDAHIRANVKQMNLDFQQLNDQSNVPDIPIPGYQGGKSFKDVIGNPMISFTLDSIVRKTAVFPNQGITWTDKDCEMLDVSPPKNPIKFLNVYVAELDSGLLGYAFFPPKTPLKNDPFNHIVMSGGAIGGPDKKGAFYLLDLGRTLAHETGHYLGLEHTFGNANTCGNDDGFSDTPRTTENMGCPAYPTKKCGGATAQTMNFMDYADDECMSMFTKQQATKMRSVLDRDIGQRRCLGISRSKESKGSSVSDNTGAVTTLASLCRNPPPIPKKCNRNQVGKGGTFAPREGNTDREGDTEGNPDADAAGDTVAPQLTVTTGAPEVTMAPKKKKKKTESEATTTTEAITLSTGNTPGTESKEATAPLGITIALAVIVIVGILAALGIYFRAKKLQTAKVTGSSYEPQHAKRPMPGLVPARAPSDIGSALAIGK